MRGIADDFARSRNHHEIELFHLKGTQQGARAARQDDSVSERASTKHLDFQRPDDGYFELSAICDGHSPVSHDGDAEHLHELFRNTELDRPGICERIDFDRAHGMGRKEAVLRSVKLHVVREFDFGHDKTHTKRVGANAL